MKKKAAKTAHSKEKPELMIGGQAVIEGVMMRTKDHYSVAVRQKGKIIVKREKFISLSKKYRVLGWPLFRGMVMLYETMVLGIKILDYSAKMDLDISKKDEKEFSSGILFTFVIATLFAIGLFKFLPLAAASLFQNAFGASNLVFNLVDGVAKFAILIGYLALISLMPDVKRLFQYHGAEHMSVACYERGEPLIVKNVRKCHKEHPRCGTSFIIFVLVLSIIFYMIIPLETGFWAKLGLRVLMLPILAGISYELIRLAGRYNNWLINIAISPGILVQKITTRKPDDKQIEVAIKSLEAVLKP